MKLRFKLKKLKIEDVEKVFFFLKYKNNKNIT